MENRLELIYDAAGQLFINKGFARTQMRDIAKEIGLSTGMLYQYFTSKKDILSFILKGTIDPEFFNREHHYPIDSHLFDDLDAEIMKTFEKNQAQFDNHLKNEDSDYSLAEMFSDAFDSISNYAVSCLIIEHNEDDLKKLSEYYRDYRKRFFNQVQQYIQLFMEKDEFRKVESIPYTTRAVVESLAWWGMHLRYDAYETDKTISNEMAKKTCLDLLLHAYQK